MSRNKSVETDHSATGAGASLTLAAGRFNVTVSGTFVGSLALERSLDEGSTWVPIAYPTPTPLAFTEPAAMVLEEAEAGAFYRSNCTAYTSGTATFRISQ